MNRHLAMLASALVLTAAPAGAADLDVVEVLKDAQITHRHAWRQGRCDLRIEITREERDGVAVLEGEVRWIEGKYALKFKMNDPDEVRFEGHPVDTEWNFIARGTDHTVSYFSRGRSFMELPDGPSNIDPIYELSPWINFAHCCAPNAGPDTTTWDQGIGPSPTLFRALKDSSFAHQTLPNGDIEQTRTDPDGYRNTRIFSAQDDFAVRSMRHLNSSGRLEHQIDFTYQKLASGVVAPQECRTEFHLRKDPAYRARYLYTNVQLPGNVTTNDFTRDALVARVDRETDRLKPRRLPGIGKPVVNDANLDPLIRSLRRANNPPPP